MIKPSDTLIPCTEAPACIFQMLPRQRSKIIAIAQKHGIVNVRFFGSVVRGEETLKSDIDILVDLEPGRSLLDLGGALVKLEELLGRKVDIVTERGLHWYLREQILKEARPL